MGLLELFLNSDQNVAENLDRELKRELFVKAEGRKKHTMNLADNKVDKTDKFTL